MSKREALAAYDLIRATYTTHSILRSPDCSTVIYLNELFKTNGRYWLRGTKTNAHGTETTCIIRKSDLEANLRSGALIVSVKDMTRPCPTDEPAHPDAGKITISLPA